MPCDSCHEPGGTPVRMDYATGHCHCAVCGRDLGVVQALPRADEPYSLVDHLRPGLLWDQQHLEGRALGRQVMAEARGYRWIPLVVFSRELARDWWLRNPVTAPDGVPEGFG